MPGGDRMLWTRNSFLAAPLFDADGSGAKTAEMLYKAWGEARYSSGSTPTTFTYTGQRAADELELMFYGARWYDSSLGRFTSPDTIIPQAVQGSQAWDRYAYSNNNPVRYNGPSGHFINVLGGAVIGALVGVGLYALNTASSGQDFNIAQAATVAAVGAASGALIATGVGAVAGIHLFAGVGMAAAAGGYLLGNAATGSEFKTTNFLSTSAYGFANGALGPIIGTTYAGATILGGTTGACSYAVTNTLNGDPITPVGLLTATGAGAISGAIGGPFPRIDNRVFVDNPSRYLLRKGIGSFGSGLFGNTLVNAVENAVNNENEPRLDETDNVTSSYGAQQGW